MSGSPPPAYTEKAAQISVPSEFPPLPNFEQAQTQPTAPPANAYVPQLNNPQPTPNQQPNEPRSHAHVSASTGSYGPFPIEMDCPYCRNHIVTKCTMIAGTLPWIIMAICFVLGFFLVIPWCLCCVPFCVDSCLDVLHSCRKFNSKSDAD
ncbi:LITAF domain-containing protein [Aphelenchoides besseyi]|nr:LITAF domain-containing protein [Aphelenchoides besseyi]